MYCYLANSELLGGPFKHVSCAIQQFALACHSLYIHEHVHAHTYLYMHMYIYMHAYTYFFVYITSTI